MKKVSLLILLFALAHFIYADDIIYLNNGDEIKSKILKISSNFIEYKKSNNLDGPAYEIPKDEVVMIIYENGEKDIFINKTAKSNNSTYNAPLQNSVNSFGIVEYDGEKLFSYNGDTITSEKYLEIARQNCYKAYEQYNRGQKLKKAGAICLGAGIGLTLGGIITHTAGIVNHNSPTTITGGIFLLTGLTSTATGIPLFCVGKSQKRKSYETFNDTSRGYISSSELQFRINNDGMGLALVF
jgi:hypothetical protein